MKNSLLSIAALTAILLQCITSADDKTLMDYMNRDTDKFDVIAEKPDEMLIKIGATGGVMFFGDPYDKKALIDYCNDVNGKASLSPLAPRTYEALFLDRHTNIVCTAPNGKGFKGQFYKPNSSEKNYQNAWLDVKFDSPQTKKYLMQNYMKRNMKPEEKKVTDLIVGGRGLYYTFENGLAMCERNGGKYFMATDVTQGYAMSSHDYLFALSSKLGNFDSIYASEYSMGKHWCVDTTDKSNEFTVTVIKQNGYNAFKPEMGVNRSQMKFSTDPIPSYLMKQNGQQNNNDAETPSSNVTQEQSNGVAMSTAPSKMATLLAMKTFSVQDTTLERQSGTVMEGMYLGTNSEGCYLAAVAKLVDRPLGHKYLYGKGINAGTISNFKQCGEGAPVEFIGESSERSFPQAIEVEYGRTLNMCKLRGGALSSQLGYDITCRRIGEVIKPAYEMTIVKKDKLVLRAIEQ